MDDRSDVFVPRLELELSKDNLEFDDLNRMFSSSNHTEKMQTSTKAGNMTMTNENTLLCFSKKKNHQHYIIDDRDLVAKLEQCLSNKIKPAAKKDSGCNDLQNHNKDGYFDLTDPQSLLVNHLKFLKSVNASEHQIMPISESQDNCDSNFGKHSIFCIKEKTFKKKTPKFSNKDLLKICLVSMNKYNAVVDEKIDELFQSYTILHSEKIANQELKKQVSKFAVLVEDNVKKERKTSDMLKIKDKEMQRHQEEVANLKCLLDGKEKNYKLEIAKMVKNEEENKLKHKKELEKLVQEKGQDKEAHEFKLEGLKKQLVVSQKENQEKKQTFFQTIQRMEVKHQEREDLNMKDIEILEKHLEEKESEKEKLESGIRVMNESLEIVSRKNKAEVARLKGTLEEKGEQLIKLMEKYNSLVLAQDSIVGVKKTNVKMEKETQADISRKDAVAEEPCVEKEGKCVKVHNDDIKSDSLQTKDQHSLDSVDVLSNQKGIALNLDIPEQGFAVLKVEDMWNEQIARHQCNLEKLKEMQSLRKDLIACRQQLEKSMQENQDLRDSLKSLNELRETHGKMLLRKKITEVEEKEKLIENLEMELIDERHASNQLAKELEISVKVQKFRDDEIEFLNETFKSERGGDYCMLTVDSMTNLKAHLKKLKDKNNSLVNYCDRVEEKMSHTKSELILTRKLGEELSKRELFSQQRCEELMSEIERKDEILRQLNERMRVLQQRRESANEEIKDGKYENATLSSKLAKSQRRLIEIEQENRNIDAENSSLKKNLAEATRDLIMSADLASHMKIRYENVEKTFEENEKRVKQLLAENAEKENEVKEFNEKIRQTNGDIQRQTKDLTNMKEERELERNELEKHKQQREKDSRELQQKIGELEKELCCEKQVNEKKETEITALYSDIKKLNERVKDFENNNNDSFKFKSEMMQEEVTRLQEAKEGTQKLLEATEQRCDIIEQDRQKLSEKHNLLQQENEQFLQGMKKLEGDLVAKESFIKELQLKQGPNQSIEGTKSLNVLSSKTHQEGVSQIGKRCQSLNQADGFQESISFRSYDGSRNSKCKDNIETQPGDFSSDDSYLNNGYGFGEQRKTTCLSVKGQNDSTNNRNTMHGKYEIGPSNTEVKNIKTVDEESKLKTDKLQEEQKKKSTNKLSWLFGDSEENNKKSGKIASEIKKENNSLFDDSFDTFLSSREMANNSRNTSRRRSQNDSGTSPGRGGNVKQSTQKSELDDFMFGISDKELKTETKRRTGSRQRCKSSQEAADELKRLSEF